MWIRRDKNKGRWRERGGMILMWRVVGRWKGREGRKIEVVGRWKGEGRRKIEEVVGKWNGKREREKGWRSVNIKKISVKNNYKKIGGKKLTLKLERLQRFVLFCLFFFFFSFKLKRFTQNLKTELKRIWVGLDSGTK